MKIAALISGGKDSIYSAYLMKKKYDLICLLNIRSKNLDSYMYHTINQDVVKLQAKSMNLPLETFTTKGEKEKELKDLERGLIHIKKKYKIGGIVTGALFSNYQKSRIEKICEKLNLKVFSPIWHADEKTTIMNMINSNFKSIIIKFAAMGFDKSWLGKEINKKTVKELEVLNKKYKVNIMGEGGEYESLVLNCPLFAKEIEIIKSVIKMDEDSGLLTIKKAKLI